MFKSNAYDSFLSILWFLSVFLLNSLMFLTISDDLVKFFRISLFGVFFEILCRSEISLKRGWHMNFEFMHVFNSISDHERIFSNRAFGTGTCRTISSFRDHSTVSIRSDQFILYGNLEWHGGVVPHCSAIDCRSPLKAARQLIALLSSLFFMKIIRKIMTRE